MFEGAQMCVSPPVSILASSPNPSDHSDHVSLGSSPQISPCWATQAQSDLAQAQVELQQIQERHKTEVESATRGIERAVLGVRREEQRLLERVEQDHRDTQQRLEQVQKENTAAARASQSLLDQRFRKLAELQREVKSVCQSESNQTGPNHISIVKEIMDFLQPWEVSVSLKKVNFKPSSQRNAVVFGDIRVQDQKLSLGLGSCGPHGQPCALHSHEMQEDEQSQSLNKEQIPHGDDGIAVSSRVVKKISLSKRRDLDFEEDPKRRPANALHWFPKSVQSDKESCQDTKTDSGYFHPGAEDATFMDHSFMDTMKMIPSESHSSPWNQRKKFPIINRRRRSLSPERRKDHVKRSHSLSLESSAGNKRKGSLGLINRPVRAARLTTREALASQSCLDLTCRGRPHSCISQSSDDNSLGTLGDSGRAVSPADSLDSSYTFIVDPCCDHPSKRSSLTHSCFLSKSALDLTHKTRPLITGGKNDMGLGKTKHGNFKLFPPGQSTQPQIHEKGQNVMCPTYRCQSILQQPQEETTSTVSKQSHVVRSLSMSSIDMSSQEPKKCRGGREVDLEELEEEDDASSPFHPGGVHLIWQFGKQGSGRSDLTLPSGIHATPQGQLFVVDCGNARIQVTDPRGNVVQQVTSSHADGSARRCRNYFDIAVNAKGLIALSCAAERALLVFNRHGRLLQTFGGSGVNSIKDELEAPRGVTVTRSDEFLVSDIRKGTLIALKLEPKTGSRLERTVVTGFHRPYLVASCHSTGMIAVSERGNETGRVPCIKVLEPNWNTVRVLGVCAGMGPVLACPWGICIDIDGNVLVADWGEEHKIVLYPAQGIGWPIVTHGLSSPRGLTLLPEGLLAVSDSMHHCIKIYQYK